MILRINVYCNKSLFKKIWSNNQIIRRNLGVFKNINMTGVSCNKFEYPKAHRDETAFDIYHENKVSFYKLRL